MPADPVSAGVTNTSSVTRLDELEREDEVAAIRWLLGGEPRVLARKRAAAGG